MKIKQQSMRNLNRIGIFKDYKKLNFIYEIKENEEDKELFEKLNIKEKTNFIPKPIGKYTNINIFGEKIKRTDLPMEFKTTTYLGGFNDWQGNQHYRIMSRTNKSRPIEKKEANEESLFIIEINNKKYISTRSFSFDDKNALFLANLMLECFKEFEVYDGEKEELIGLKTKNKQWEILPKGKYPWEKVLEKIISNNPNDIKYIKKRFETIYKNEPDFVAVGLEGFYGYLVFAFESKNLYILESEKEDNATYVFEENWESFSKYTKKEIIEENLHKERIIHSKNWTHKINKLLNH